MIQKIKLLQTEMTCDMLNPDGEQHQYQQVYFIFTKIVLFIFNGVIFPLLISYNLSVL